MQVEDSDRLAVLQRAETGRLVSDWDVCLKVLLLIEQEDFLLELLGIALVADTLLFCFSLTPIYHQVGFHLLKGVSGGVSGIC